MCSDDVSGPLSEVMLSQVICPADIPLVMQRVRTHSIDVMVMLSLEEFDILDFKFATQINSW